MNEHPKKVERTQEERKRRFEESLWDLSEVSLFIATDHDLPSPLRQDYERTLLAINEANKNLRSLYEKIFS